MFQFRGLDQVDEIHALFEDISVTEKGAWGPTQKICLDEIESFTTQQDKSYKNVSVTTRPSSSKNSGKCNERQHKRSRCLDEDIEI